MGAWCGRCETSGVLIELDHDFGDGTITYPGLPGPVIGEHLSREDSRATYTGGAEFTIGRITLVANTGTYLDSPFHRYADGVDLAGLPLDQVADLPVHVLHGTRRAVDESDLAVLDGRDLAGAAVLLHTGGDRGWGTPDYAVDAPYLTEAAARWLADRRPALVGIDSINLDDLGDRSRPAHSVLLGAGVLVLEHLTGLAALPDTGARLHAAPPRIHDFGTFPVRAYAVVP